MGKRILTLQDFSSIGRCSLTTAIPIIFTLGNEAVALPTSHYSAQTAIDDFLHFDMSDHIMPTYNHFKKLNIKFDCLYTGFLGTMNAILQTIEIAKDMKEKNIFIAVDPAMADNGELYSVFDKKYFEKMKELATLADLLMPNFTEGKMLAEIDEDLPSNKENAIKILNALNNKGYKNVVLSGVEDFNKCGVGILENNSISFTFNKKFNHTIHGAGDILSSIIVSTLQNGKNLNQSAKIAVDFLSQAINRTLKNKTNLKFGLDIEDCLYLLDKNK